jgi:hypothetical protein
MFEIIVSDNVNSVEFITVNVAETKKSIGVLTIRLTKNFILIASTRISCSIDVLLEVRNYLKRRTGIMYIANQVLSPDLDRLDPRLLYQTALAK